jgi:hypothetical protein
LGFSPTLSNSGITKEFTHLHLDAEIGFKIASLKP